MVRILTAPAAQQACKSLRQSTGAARQRHKLESNARAAASRRDRAGPRLLHHSSVRPLSDFPFALQPSTAQNSGSPAPAASTSASTLGCSLPQIYASPPTRATPSNSLAEPSSIRTQSDPRSVEITSSSYTTQFTPIPELDKLPLQSLLRRHSYHNSPRRKFISSTSTLALHTLYNNNRTAHQREGGQILKYQYCLHAAHLLPPPCRRSPFSSPRTHGHAPQPLNGYAITSLILRVADYDWTTVVRTR
jgi:hypothetical protein